MSEKNYEFEGVCQHLNFKLVKDLGGIGRRIMKNSWKANKGGII